MTHQEEIIDALLDAKEVFVNNNLVSKNKEPLIVENTEEVFIDSIDKEHKQLFLKTWASKRS